MIVILSDRAVADLEEIADWIAADNPRRAASFVEELVATCRSLAERPRRFPLVTEIDDRPIHKRVWRGYVILYRPAPEAVEIVRITHGSRDWAALLDE